MTATTLSTTPAVVPTSATAAGAHTSSPSDSSSTAAAVPAAKASHLANNDDLHRRAPPPPPDDDPDAMLDSMIDLEAEIRNEAELMAQEAAGDDGADSVDVFEEGGGFFVAEEEDSGAAAAASDANTAAGASTAAATASPADDPDSIEADEPARPFASGCRECGSIGVQQNYLIAFGVSICFRCQQLHKARYALCTQTTATTQYLLPLPLVQTLGYIERKNPHKQAWGTMKLYWKQQVLKLVRDRYGTRENLEQAKRDRDLARIKKDDARRKNAHRTAAKSAAFSSTLAASMTELRNQTPAEVVAMLAQRTKGMAPTSRHTKDVTARKSRKKRNSEEGAEELANEDDQVIVLDDDDAPKQQSRGKKKAKTQASAAEAKRKALHTHSFVTRSDGSQQCTDPACGFVMEFESF